MYGKVQSVSLWMFYNTVILIVRHDNVVQNFFSKKQTKLCNYNWISVC